ncbi:MAG: nitroreductase family protein [Halioglobus sp.]|nr:nitroreductase family protein [Halioglobus sp.]
MSDIIQFLQQRNSAPKLTEPGPSAGQLEEIFRAGLRAPDHGRLRPWRFISIAGDRRIAFGELLEHCLVARSPNADITTRDKARNAPLRAPLVVVVVVNVTEHPKVPAMEQRLSGACAAQGILLATEASGFAAIWRTGANAFDRAVMDGLGLKASEEIIGFLYIGSRQGPGKPIPELNTSDFVSSW